ncbi:hypothetical protein IKG33_01620 [Candidatus Saccharibacteria bacterium]|nr:hypothetical protein [Candidatus Saccharibacteria bacterium]
MKKNGLKSIFLAVGLLVCSTFGALRVFAEDENSSTLIVSPTSQKMVLIPGETVTGTIKVSNPNNAASDLDYSVHIGSFSQKKDGDSVDDYGTVDTDIVSNYNMMMDWIVLGKESGSVAPNETDVVPFTISVPETAPAGGQYATIIVKDDTKRLSEGDGNVMIQSVTQIASIIYAEVTGETKNVGQILENNIPGLVLSNPLSATSMVSNDGNIHTNAKYTFQVWPLFGDEEICTNEEKPTESLVMPETEKYHVEECDLPAVGIFRAKQIVEIFGETSEVEKTIIACPIWLLFLIAFVIVGIIIWLIMRMRSRDNKKKRTE